MAQGVAGRVAALEQAMNSVTARVSDLELVQAQAKQIAADNAKAIMGYFKELTDEARQDRAEFKRLVESWRAEVLDLRNRLYPGDE